MEMLYFSSDDSLENEHVCRPADDVIFDAGRAAAGDVDFDGRRRKGRTGSGEE